MRDLVSAIITTHKRAPNILKRAIESVLSQTYSCIEVIIVDDAPDYEKHNEIVSLVESFGEKVSYYINEKPGACASRNLGIGKAQGKYIALLDDDDEWLPEKLDILLPLFHGNVGLVYGSFKTISNGESINKVLERKKYRGNVEELLFRKGNFIGGCSIPVFLRSSIIDVGMFDESLLSAQDFDVWIRIAKKYEVEYTEKPVINYYVSGDAITSSSFNRIKGRIQILDKYHKEYNKFTDAKRMAVRNIIYYMIAAGEYKKAFDFNKKHYKILTKKGFAKVLLKGTLKCILIRLHIQNR